jgi:hypothetical protein
MIGMKFSSGDLIHVIIVFTLVLTFCGCREEDKTCVVGSGQTQNFELNVSDFDKIYLSGPIDLHISQASEYDVLITAEPEIYGLMDNFSNGRELTLGFRESSRCFESDIGVKAFISLPDLREIRVVGASNIRSTDSLILSDLILDIAGVADLILQGRAETLTLRASGVVTVQFLEFETRAVMLNISGTGNLDLFCSEFLDIDVSGAAIIRYKGSPVIRQTVAGTLELIDLN